jgi:uncharacterized protein (TIGR02147 family)
MIFIIFMEMKYISIFDFSDYRKFVSTWLAQQPHKGRGFFTQLATKLSTSNAAVTQIFKGHREMSQEHALELSEEFNFNPKELLYFLLLTDYSRTSSHKLKKVLSLQIQKTQTEQKDLVNKVEKDKVLTDEMKSVYYSSWVYTGLRNLIATEQYNSIHLLAERLKLPPNQVNKAIDFLIQNQFLTFEKNKLITGPQKTHLESNSPFITKHHQNWRIKSLVEMENHSEKDLFYTAPMSLSEDLAEQIRGQLAEFIKNLVTEIGPSKSETVRCLNIDWFAY